MSPAEGDPAAATSLEFATIAGLTAIVLAAPDGTREILAKVPTPNNAVLVAVSPDQHAIEVVYGSQVRGRGAESAAPLGVAAAASAFQEGKLIDGLVSAVRVTSAGIRQPQRCRRR